MSHIKVESFKKLPLEPSVSHLEGANLVVVLARKLCDCAAESRGPTIQAR